MDNDPEKTEDNGKKPLYFDPGLRLDWMVLTGVTALTVLAALLVCILCIPPHLP